MTRIKPFATCLTCLVFLGALQLVLADEAAIFEKPIRLEAGGKVIDTGDNSGHSGPTMADVDGDGIPDLVVGDFSGQFRVFRNRCAPAPRSSGRPAISWQEESRPRCGFIAASAPARNSSISTGMGSSISSADRTTRGRAIFSADSARAAMLPGRRLSTRRKNRCCAIRGSNRPTSPSAVGRRWSIGTGTATWTFWSAGSTGRSTSF